MHEKVAYRRILAANCALSSRSKHNPKWLDALPEPLLNGTKRGFLSWHPDSAVLNFFYRVLAPRHSLIFLGLRLARSKRFTNA